MTLSRGEFRYSIGETIKNGLVNCTILDRYRTTKNRPNGLSVNEKRYIIRCNHCGWSHGDKIETRLEKTKCQCCVGKVVVEGINDIPTTHPHLVEYFQGGYDEAKKYSHGSCKKVGVICPFCGTKKSKKIGVNSIVGNNGIGCNCKDGVSYPEKFMSKLLSVVEVEHVTQYSPLWANEKFYDFYIPALNAIIEVHGQQHYLTQENRPPSWRTYEEEHENDLLKFDLSVINGIEYYIVLDCRKSELEWIKNSIMSSKLPKLLGFKEEDIDWLKCEEYTKTNKVKEICKSYMAKGKPSPQDLARFYNTNQQTINQYLKDGTRLGWCDYDPKESKTRLLKARGRQIDVYRDGVKLNKEPHPSAKELIANSQELYGVKLYDLCLARCLRGERDSYKGLTFKYARGDKNDL